MMTLRLYNHGQPSPYLWLYAQYGSTPSQIAHFLMNSPARVLANLNTRENRFYILQLLYPLAFLPLLAPEATLMAMPTLLSNLLSRRHSMHLIDQQYTALITPYLIVAAILGIGRWRQWGNRATMCIMAVVLLLCAFDATSWGPYRSAHWSPPPEMSDERARQLQEILRFIPRQSSVSAQAMLVPYLSHRRYVYSFPNPFYRVAWGSSVRTLEQLDGTNYLPYSPAMIDKALEDSTVEYIALCPSTATFPLNSTLYSSVVSTVLQNPKYAVIRVNPVALLLRRSADYGAGIALLKRFTGVPLRARNGFAHTMRALGWEPTFHEAETETWRKRR
jgi:hypothetical protein